MTKHKACASIVAVSLLPLLTAGTACRSKETTASRSAAAYDQALQKGTPVQKGEAHGAHGQAAAPGEAAGKAKADAAMAGMDHSRMAGQKGRRAMADHARMTGQQGTQAMTGMDHSKMTGMAPSQTTGVDHAAMGPGAQMRPPAPEPATAVAQPGQPAATLRQDDLDGPAPTSLRDAERSAAMAKERAGGMQHGAPYRQTDAGRDSAPSTSHEHGAPSAPPSAQPDPHRGHAAPTPQPKASPGPQAAPKAQPSPGADHHQMHRAPAPRPTPSPKPSPRHHQEVDR